MGIPKSVEQAREYSNNINNVDATLMPQNEQNLAIRYALHDIAKQTGEAPAFNFDYSPVDYDDTLSSEIYKPYVNPLQDALGMLLNAVPSVGAAMLSFPTIMASGGISLLNDALERITGDDYDDPKIQAEKKNWFYDPAARGSIEWTNSVNDFFDSWKYKASDKGQEKLDVTDFWATANPNNVAANIGNGIGSVIAFIGTIALTKGMSGGGSVKLFQGLSNISKAEVLGSYMYMNNEVYNEFRNNAKIDDLTAAKLSSLVSLPIALTEYVGLSALRKVMTKPMVKNAIKGGVEDALASYGTKGLTKELYQDFTAKAIQGIGNRMTIAALKGAEGAVIEGVQEYAQGKMQQASEALYDKIANEKVFGTELFDKQALKDDINNAFWGGVIGGLLGMGGGMINSKEMQESVFHYVGINLQKNRPAKIDGVKKFITQLGENGKITPEQTEQGLKMVDEMVAVHKEAMPLSLTDIDARYQAYEFIQARNKIQADLLALDEKPVDPTLAKADSELRTIMEQSAEAYDEAIALIAKTKGQISESELGKKLFEIGTQFNKVEAPVEEVKTDITPIENKEELTTEKRVDIEKRVDNTISKIFGSNELFNWDESQPGRKVKGEFVPDNLGEQIFNAINKTLKGEVQKVDTKESDIYFKELAKKIHPDKHQDELLKAISEKFFKAANIARDKGYINVLKEINNKYDEELSSLGINQSNQEETKVEDKIAEIKRRRQEDLDRETPVKNENITVDFGGGLFVKYQVITYKNGSVKISTTSEKSKRYNELSDEVFRDYAKIDFESDAKGIIKTELVKNDYTDKQSQEVQVAKEKTINAKYDAELAALEGKKEEVKVDLAKNDEMLKKAEKALKATITKIEQLKTQPLGAKESQAARDEKIANFEERKKQIETKIGELNAIREAETRVEGVEETGAVVETADTGVSAEEVRVTPDEVVAEVKVEPDVNEVGQDVQEDVQVEGEKDLPNYGKVVRTKIGDIDLVIEPNLASENKKSIKISAYNSDGKTIGVSSASINDSNKSLTIKVSQIKDEYQRKGIYSKIIDEYEIIAKDRGLKLETELEAQTENSKSFWENRNSTKEQPPKKSQKEKKVETDEEKNIKKDIAYLEKKLSNAKGKKEASGIKKQIIERKKMLNAAQKGEAYVAEQKVNKDYKRGVPKAVKDFVAADTYGMALQYFGSGGRVSRQSFEDATGLFKTEAKEKGAGRKIVKGNEEYDASRSMFSEKAPDYTDVANELTDYQGGEIYDEMVLAMEEVMRMRKADINAEIRRNVEKMQYGWLTKEQANKIEQEEIENAKAEQALINEYEDILAMEQEYLSQQIGFNEQDLNEKIAEAKDEVRLAQQAYDERKAQLGRELAKEQPALFEKSKERAYDFEAKKAALERRRQEELKQLSSEKDIINVPLNEIEKYIEFDRELQPNPMRGDNYLNDLEKDIKDNGIQNPIVLEKYNNEGYIQEGNHRVAVAKRLKLNTIPVKIEERDRPFNQNKGGSYLGKKVDWNNIKEIPKNGFSNITSNLINAEYDAKIAALEGKKEDVMDRGDVNLSQENIDKILMPFKARIETAKRNLEKIDNEAQRNQAKDLDKRQTIIKFEQDIKNAAMEEGDIIDNMDENGDIKEDCK